MGVGMKRNVSAQEDGRDPARLSTGSVRHPEAIDVRDGTAGPGHAEDSSAGGRFDGPTILDRPSPNLPPELDPNIIARLQEERLRDLLDLAEDGDGSEDDDMHSDDDERSFAYDARPGDLPTAFSFEDGPVVGRVYPDSQIDETNDDDGDDYYYDDEIDDLNDNEDEDEYMHQGWEDEDDGNFDDEDIEDEDVYTGPGHALWRSADSEFGGVDMITPRRTFKGAKNIETVKDCKSMFIRSYEAL
jgi:nuclear receptor interaction protein